jgi:hypothetical protein
MNPQDPIRAALAGMFMILAVLCAYALFFMLCPRNAFSASGLFVDIPIASPAPYVSASPLPAKLEEAGQACNEDECLSTDPVAVPSPEASDER